MILYETSFKFIKIKSKVYKCVRAYVLVVVSACISNENASFTVTENSTPNKKIEVIDSEKFRCVRESMNRKGNNNS
jgi:hypothetical protein